MGVRERIAGMEVCTVQTHRGYSGRTGGILRCNHGGCMKVSRTWLDRELHREEVEQRFAEANAWEIAWSAAYD